MKNAILSPDESPCLKLPGETWAEPPLRSQSLSCRQQLRYNPIIGDNQRSRCSCGRNLWESRQTGHCTQVNPTDKKRKHLFVCMQNRMRSPTAEKLFSDHPRLEVKSAGVDKDSTVPVTVELLEWADLVFVMEKKQRNIIHKRVKDLYQTKRRICLYVPDDLITWIPFSSDCWKIACGHILAVGALVFHECAARRMSVRTTQRKQLLPEVG